MPHQKSNSKNKQRRTTTTTTTTKIQRRRLLYRPCHLNPLDTLYLQILLCGLVECLLGQYRVISNEGNITGRDVPPPFSRTTHPTNQQRRKVISRSRARCVENRSRWTALLHTFRQAGTQCHAIEHKMLAYVCQGRGQGRVDTNVATSIVMISSLLLGSPPRFWALGLVVLELHDWWCWSFKATERRRRRQVICVV